jgi:hypothetical protein
MAKNRCKVDVIAALTNLFLARRKNQPLQTGVDFYIWLLLCLTDKQSRWNNSKIDHQNEWISTD